MEFDARKMENFLAEVWDKFREDEGSNFRCICLSSDLSVDELLELFGERFEISSQGDFFELRSGYKKYGTEIDVYLYLYYDKSSDFPLIFTKNSSVGFRRTAGPIIESNKGIYYSWKPPRIIESLKEEILDIERCKLNHFHYKKLSSEKRFDKERRPEFHRKGEYNGEDAEKTLDEMKIEYGITPTTLGFKIPSKAQFKFSTDGEYTLKKGDPFYFYEKIVKRGIEKAKNLNKTIKQTELDLKIVDGTEKIKEQSLKIKIQNTLNNENADNFLNELKESNFYPYNITNEKDSLLLDGRIVDEKNGGMLSITTNGETFSVLPKYGTKFDTLMRFYRFIINKIDSEANMRLG